MSNLNFSIEINANAKKVWQVLWDDILYRKWTAVFTPGSYAVSDWKEGSKIQFLNPSGNGMFSIITACKEFELMTFKHLGIVKQFEEQPESEETKQWGNAIESYLLKEENGITLLNVTLEANDQIKDFLTGTYPKALVKIRCIYF